MLESVEGVISGIGDIVTGIGSFLGSIAEAVAYVIEFIGNVIVECGALLSVIPLFVSSLIVTAIMFSVIVALKRLVID